MNTVWIYRILNTLVAVGLTIMIAYLVANWNLWSRYYVLSVSLGGYYLVFVATVTLKRETVSGSNTRWSGSKVVILRIAMVLSAIGFLTDGASEAGPPALRIMSYIAVVLGLAALSILLGLIPNCRLQTQPSLPK